MRRGQVGELLVVVAVLASVFIIVATTTTSRDVPDVQRAALEGLGDVRGLLSQAILDWLSDGPVDRDLACNGIYPVGRSELTAGIAPYVQDRLVSGIGNGDIVNVTPGVLRGLEFVGLDGFRIVLANGSVVYDDGSIYAADFYDQEYFFNVRLPLALEVVQDWVRCDAGNLSLHLAEEFGEECFFGIKDNRYPGGCISNPKRQFDVESFDKEYMRAKGINPARIASGVGRAVDELNSYFAGEASCDAPPLAEDTGITCSFQLEDVDIQNEMLPWSSSKIVVLEDVPTSTVSKGQLRAMGEYLDFQDFVNFEDHVYALPAQIETARWEDDVLGCIASPEREPVNTPVNSSQLFTEPDRVDLVTGDRDVFASPVLYVNMTRGAKFRLNVRCVDAQVTLLGQPLEYSFSLKHGVRQHCGPDKMKNGNFMCSGCGLKPGIDQSGCKTFAAPSCGTAIKECSESLVWLYTIQKSPELGVWKGSYDATIRAPENLALREDINASCGAVYGMFDRYPPPRDEEGDIVCPGAQATTCCIVPGYNETCDPSKSFDNPDCYYSMSDYIDLCTAPRSCGEKTCKRYVCDENTVNEDGEIFSCVESDALPDGTACRDDSGCFACEGGACAFQDGMEGQECTPGNDDRDTCRKSVCRADAGDSGACISEAIPDSEGESCSSGFVRSGPCSLPVCGQDGICRPEARPDAEGTPCAPFSKTVDEGDRICTYEYKCAEFNGMGFCQQEAPESAECEPKEGGQDCDPPCTLNGDGICRGPDGGACVN